MGARAARTVRRVTRSALSNPDPRGRAEAMTAPATDPAALLGALVDLVANAVVVRLRAAGPPAASGAEAPSTWYSQETSPIARRTYLALCRSGAVESKKVGKTILVKRKVLDAWIAANGTSSTSPATVAARLPPAPTNEQLMRAAGFCPRCDPARR